MQSEWYKKIKEKKKREKDQFKKTHTLLPESEKDILSWTTGVPALQGLPGQSLQPHPGMRLRAHRAAQRLCTVTQGLFHTLQKSRKGHLSPPNIPGVHPGRKLGSPWYPHEWVEYPKLPFCLQEEEKLVCGAGTEEGTTDFCWIHT